MFRGADENSKHSDDEDGTSTDEPNEQIESQLFSPSLTNVHTLHPTNIRQTWRWDPPSEYPTKGNPLSTSRTFLHHFSSFSFLNFTSKSLLLHQTSFIGVLEHISGRSIRFRTKMRVSLIMLTREFTSSVIILALNGLVLKVVLVQIRSLERALGNEW